MYIYIFITFVIIILTIIFISKKDISSESTESLEMKPDYKYIKKDFLITKSEHLFFNILLEILGDRYHIFPQIHISSVLDHKAIGQNWKGAFSHINQKSIDYLICDKVYIRPIIAIELDDKSHEIDERKDRDFTVEQIFKDANMPLLRFESKAIFNKEEIKEDLLKKLNDITLPNFSNL